MLFPENLVLLAGNKKFDAHHLTLNYIRSRGDFMGYHLRHINKGTFGEASKLQEELDELVDAEEQGNQIMAMCELADLYGALKAIADRYGLTMTDLQTMSDATARAFQDGSRR